STRRSRPFGPAPRGITTRTICSVTGKIADKNCRSRREYFLPGTEPSEKCDSLHGKLSNISELISREKNSEGSSADTKLFDRKVEAETDDSETFIFR
ncbi:MAG TPA: hypothetical protein PK986_01550, partial [Spirochaetota bacterium]|nr:hypothetical protein [Spirochaetota bacterium]